MCNVTGFELLSACLLVSEARWREDVHVPGFEFVRTSQLLLAAHV